MAENYRLHKRNYKRDNGEEYFTWWYSCWENGKRERAPAGYKCTIKREAQEFVDALQTRRKNEKKKAAEATALAALPEPVQAALGITTLPEAIPHSVIKASRRIPTLREYATGLFLPLSKYLRRQEVTDGIKIAEETRKGHRGRLDNYIIPQWGSYPLVYFERPDFVLECHDWLVDIRRTDGGPASGSLRNNIVETFSITLRSARHDRLIKNVPKLKRFVRMSKRQDTLSLQELERLFPASRDALAGIWTLEDHRDNQKVGIMLAAAFCLSVSCGLRSGEFRAIIRENILRLRAPNGTPVYLILVMESIHARRQVGKLKKATEAESRARVVQASGRTIDILDLWLAESGIASGPLFLFRGRYMTKEFVNRRWKAGLEQAGIDTTERRLTMHSARYTYTSQMRRLLSPQILQEFTGHRSAEMTDLYDNPHLEDLVRQIAASSSAEAVEKFWG